MDQGLGLKNTHPVEDLASSSDYSGHVYESKETERVFLLIVHIKGYRKEHVDIDISEDRTWISIGLQKQAQEDVKSGRSMKKNIVFRIPDGVNLSLMKAKFNEQESILRIEMPKLEKGVVGVRVEEVKDEEADKKDDEEVKKEGADIETPQIALAASDEIPEKNGEEVKEKGADIETPHIAQAASDEVPEKDGEEVKKEGADIETPQIAQAASDEVPEKDGEEVKEEGADIETPQIAQASSDEVPKKDGEEVKKEGADIETPQIAQASSDEVPEKDGEEVKKEGADIETPQIAQASSNEVPEKDGEKMEVAENFHAKGKEVDKEENRNEIQELQAENLREIQESEESKTVKSKQADGIEKKREDAKETIKEEKLGEVKKDKSTEASHQVAELSRETEVVTEPRIEKQKRPEKKEVDECESSGLGKGKDVGGKSTPETKPAATEKSNLLRTPLIIVGSALLVSIVLLAINRIRKTKR